MNESDQLAVNELRNHLQDVATMKYTDFDYLRWLQGFDYQIEVIKPKLRRYFQIIQSYDFDNHNPHPMFMKYYPTGLLGNTLKDDTLVVIQHIGKIDGYGIMKTVDSLAVMKCLIQSSERILDAIRKRELETGRQSGVTIISDLEGFHMNEKQLALMLGPLKLILQDCVKLYVEVMQKCVWINAPKYVNYVFQVVKTLLPEKVKNKIIILGENWKNEILEHIHPDALPVQWGGNLVDENNNGQLPSKVTMSRKVCTSDYWQPSSCDPPLSELDNLIVAAGRYEYLTINVLNVGAKLSWYFYANKDYGFGVFFSEEEDQSNVDHMQMIYPICDRVPGPSYIPEKDEIICPKVGFYKIRFNNDFSWIYKLKVKYKITIEKNT